MSMNVVDQVECSASMCGGCGEREGCGQHDGVFFLDGLSQAELQARVAAAADELDEPARVLLAALRRLGRSEAESRGYLLQAVGLG